MRDPETIPIKARRGFGLGGSTTHRVLAANGETWRLLDELKVGEWVAIRGGAGLFPAEEVTLRWASPRRMRRVRGGVAVAEAFQVHERNLTPELAALLGQVSAEPARVRVLPGDEELEALLTYVLGNTGSRTAQQIPVPVLQSPEPVLRAFLRAYFDCDGHAGKQGVILSTMSDKLASQVQLVLLNFGILSRRRRQTDGCWHVHVMGASAARFAERIGFGLERKQAALDTYVRDRKWFKHEKWDDEV